MKKVLSSALVLVLCLGLIFMTGCGGGNIKMPYSEYDLTEYVTLPDYDSYTTSEPDVTITDEDIDEAIQEVLDANPTQKEVTEGTVEEGDTIRYSYKGTLADGSTTDGMNADDQQMTLGEANMIDGFQEGLYGATIGKPVTLDLAFPDPYSLNEDLSGKAVTFVVTVTAKIVDIPAELTDDFVKEHSDEKTVADYRKYIASQLEKEERENQLFEIKDKIWTQIAAETEITEAIAEEVDAKVEMFNTRYEQQAEQQGLQWEEFLDQYFKYDTQEYDEQIRLYAESMVKLEMTVYAAAKKEGVKVSKKEYQEQLDSIMANYGYTDAETFENAAGMSLEQFAEEQYSLKLNMFLEEVLDSIYERLIKNEK